VPLVQERERLTNVVEFQNIRPRPLPRAYRDADDFFRDLADLVIALRVARAAWESGPAALGEWHAFGQALRSALWAGTSLPMLIEEAQSWSAGWWRRAFLPSNDERNGTGPWGGRRRGESSSAAAPHRADEQRRSPRF
jgi:hypothetical protein